ncbi:hypothetical protein BGZ70_002049 [Mortierella alpina]|uniref:Uncharacterized protein n=1 Tax=Mortierella alpina TaxID=64518 RepID=A0A9P6LXE4_MORAP|nr:hypothetical protein BGZ70_002049 [Mortierella alpina]
MTSPFDQYDKVDMHVVDDANPTRHNLLQAEVDLNIGVMAVRLEAILFPEDLPIRRLCHIVLTGVGNSLDGTHRTLNSSSFFMIRTMKSINGTLVPLPPAASTLLPSASTALPASTTTRFSSARSNAASATSEGFPVSATNPAQPEKSSALSPLVIALISVGSGAMVIALVALGLLYRTRRRFKGNTGGHFKSLHDHPSSPTDGASKSSIYKSEGGPDLGVAAEAPFLGPTFGGALAGRNSSNTARSAEPMMKGAPGMLGYNNEALPSTSAPLPLLERKPSTLYHVPESASDAAAAAAAAGVAGAGTKEAKGDPAAGVVDRPGRPSKEPVLSAGDAQLIAETFRKSMRKPRWEDEEDEEEERDEARRAAKELLRKELSEEGVDVQRGVQRRVTIRDRPHRSSLSPPVSQSVTMPEP